MVRAIWKTDHEIVGLYSRNEREARACVRGEKVELYSDIATLPDTADVYLICVNDDAISEISKSLPESIRLNQIVAHTSGSQSIDSLKGIENKGSFYPVQTFTKGRKMQYNDIPFCINATETKVEDKLIKLAESISKDINLVDDEQRKQIHLSAVIINNFVNHLVYKSEELIEQHGLPIEILKPLLHQTIAKLNKVESYDAQTGPAVRNDQETIKGHIDMLNNDGDKALYQTITNSIIETYKK